MLQDSDTRGLLQGIQERNHALSWFWTDWPIYNHFYRPFPSLAFELDWWLYRDDAAGYGATQAILVMLCVALLAWNGALLFRSVLWGAVAALIFSRWLLPGTGLPNEVLVLAVGALALRVRNHIPWWAILSLLLLLWAELHPVAPLYFRSIGWLPGRTATIMAGFCLLSTGAFLAHWRTGARAWLVVCLLAGAGAMASYEQAVMLPAVLLAFWFLVDNQISLRGAWSWLILAGYGAVRYAVIPRGVSRYQDQQFREGPGVWLSLTSYAAPPLGHLTSMKIAAESAFVPFLVSAAPWWSLMHFPAYFGGAAALIKTGRWKVPLSLWLASTVAFAPMAFMKPFEHYHFWPMTLKALLVAGIIRVCVLQEEAEE